MKTTKALSLFLVAGATIIGAGCSSTNTGTSAGTTGGSGTTAGGATGTSSSMDTGMSGSSATGTSTADPSASPAGVGGSAGTGTGSAASGAGTGATDANGSITTTGTAGSTSAASGTAAAADMTAFMATFATMKDPVFLMNAASSNLLELQAAKMATQQSTNADVKKFAQMMISHHTRATQDLKAVAKPLGVTLPQIMMPVHQAMVDRLTKKTGKDFDEAYMDLMETAHKMDIAMFEVKSKAAETPAVQTFATKTLPMLRSHHSMADTTEDKAD